jgi:hypothetical protein
VVDLIAIQFLMARDREMPTIFQRLNRWGVPTYGMILAAVVPAALVVAVKDLAGLADLYCGRRGRRDCDKSWRYLDRRHLGSSGQRALSCSVPLLSWQRSNFPSSSINPTHGILPLPFWLSAWFCADSCKSAV